MFCSKCGAKLPKNSEFCSECGNSVSEVQNNEVKENTGSSIGWGILGFFVPLAGLILYLVWKQERPGDAKAAGMGALIWLILYILLIILVFIFLGIAFAVTG